MKINARRHRRLIFLVPITIALCLAVAKSSVSSIEYCGGALSLAGFFYAFQNLRRPAQIEQANEYLSEIDKLLPPGAGASEALKTERRRSDGLVEALIYSALGGAIGSFSTLLAAIPKVF